jgi:hypothetical protein
VTDRRLRLAALVALVLGVGLMVPFEHPVTLALGVACLFAFIALGAFGLLTPERLSRERGEGETPPRGEP